MILPKHIQLIMLSATLASPEDFAQWIENIKGKEIYLTTTNERIVPLNHYLYFNINNGFFKKIKEPKYKEIEISIKNNIDKLILIQDSKNNFNNSNNNKINSFINLLNKNNYKIKKNFILNELIKLLKKNNMLPAICFVLNRKLLELYANEININLFDENDEITKITNIENDCFNILKKLPNYKEYINLTEYQKLINLAQKGIAIHHAGIIPILREMTELLFQKGYIKLLFATETFALGINMPTKSVIFTSLSKFDGSYNRFLYCHEYTQMAGRAGRRGLDNIGYVIHCANFYTLEEINNIQNILKGTPQKILSKFKISYQLLLNLINNKQCNIENIISYIKKSILQNELNSENFNNYKQIQIYYNELNSLQETLTILTTPKNIIEDFINLNNLYNNSVNKKKYNILKQINLIKDDYKNIEKDILIYNNYQNKLKNINNLETDISNLYNYFYNKIKIILNYLLENEYVILYNNIINIDNNNENRNKLLNYKITFKGTICLELKEINSILGTELLLNNKLNSLNPCELTCFLSCLCDYNINENLKINNINNINNINKSEDFININIHNLNNLLFETKEKMILLNDYEIKNQIDSGLNFSINYDLIEYIYQWYNANNEEQCKLILENLKKEKELFSGEFIKIILKIQAIINELMNICHLLNNMLLLHNLNQIPNNILKFIATNQSLYV